MSTSRIALNIAVVGAFCFGVAVVVIQLWGR